MEVGLGFLPRFSLFSFLEAKCGKKKILGDRIFPLGRRGASVGSKRITFLIGGVGWRRLVQSLVFGFQFHWNWNPGFYNGKERKGIPDWLKKKTVSIKGVKVKVILCVLSLHGWGRRLGKWVLGVNLVSFNGLFYAMIREEKSCNGVNSFSRVKLGFFVSHERLSFAIYGSSRDLSYYLTF